MIRKSATRFIPLLSNQA